MPTVAELERVQLINDLRTIAQEEDLSFFKRVSSYFPFAKEIARREFERATSEEHIRQRFSEGFGYASMQTDAARRAMIALRNGLTEPTLERDEVLAGMRRLVWAPPRRGTLLEFVRPENAS